MVKLDYVEVKFKLRQPSLFRNDWFELEDEEEQDLYKQAIDKALKYQCFPSKVIMVLGKKRLQSEPCPQTFRFIYLYISSICNMPTNVSFLKGMTEFLKGEVSVMCRKIILIHGQGPGICSQDEKRFK